jgi:hypothetical protein
MQFLIKDFMDGQSTQGFERRIGDRPRPGAQSRRQTRKNAAVGP